MGLLARVFRNEIHLLHYMSCRMYELALSTNEEVFAIQTMANIIPDLRRIFSRLNPNNIDCPIPDPLEYCSNTGIEMIRFLEDYDYFMNEGLSSGASEEEVSFEKYKEVIVTVLHNFIAAFDQLIRALDANLYIFVD